MLTNWKQRALDAEAELVRQQAIIEQLNQRAYVVDIRPAGRKIMFSFMKAGEVIKLDFYKLMTDDIQDWQRKLL